MISGANRNYMQNKWGEKDFFTSDKGGYHNISDNGSWKLVGERGKEPQLYNLCDDFGEHCNVAAEQPEMVRQLQEELAK